MFCYKSEEKIRCLLWLHLTLHWLDLIWKVVSNSGFLTLRKIKPNWSALEESDKHVSNKEVEDKLSYEESLRTLGMFSLAKAAGHMIALFIG